MNIRDGRCQKLAKELGYRWFDVCEIIWRAKHHKQPEFKEILIFSVIRKNLIRIKSGKPLRDIYGNLVRRRKGEAVIILVLICLKDLILKKLLKN